MYDVNKHIGNARLLASDPEGHLAGLDHWSPRTASRLAEADGMILEEEHWQVLFCLRGWFRECGPDWTARDVTRRLEREYADLGGRRYLYGLFPHGPLAQGCHLAGLPLPVGTLSMSFGSVH